jgi:hypothetical protein
MMVTTAFSTAQRLLRLERSQPIADPLRIDF